MVDPGLCKEGSNRVSDCELLKRSIEAIDSGLFCFFRAIITIATTSNYEYNKNQQPATQKPTTIP
jgi:hypothetical protein